MLLWCNIHDQRKLSIHIGGCEITVIYVMSDIHGYYDKYIRMLERINFSENDTLYVVGDVIDRGDDGIKILLDMMNRENVIPILGNHEYMAYSVLKKLNVEITEFNYDKHLDSEALEMYEDWMFNGGITTSQQFSRLSKIDKDEILDYLGEFDIYEEIEVNGRSFLLVHGGVGEFETEKDIEDCNLHEIIWSRCDYDKQYYKDKYMITGHTPTFTISKEYDGKIYNNNNHIAIDCGVSHGRPLGCVCLDTLEEFYVE